MFHLVDDDSCVEESELVWIRIVGTRVGVGNRYEVYVRSAVLGFPTGRSSLYFEGMDFFDGPHSK